MCLCLRACECRQVSFRHCHLCTHTLLLLYFYSTEVEDYTALTRAVTLTPTVTQQCVSVMIEDDSVLEETESLTVSLSLTGVLDGVQLSRHTATIFITNDDGKKYLCVDAAGFNDKLRQL